MRCKLLTPPPESGNGYSASMLLEVVECYSKGPEKDFDSAAVAFVELQPEAAVEVRQKAVGETETGYWRGGAPKRMRR